MSRPLATLLILALWALIYLPGLGTLELKGEEGRRILPAVTMLQTGNYLVPYVGSDPYFRKPPLVNWLVAASFKLTGQRNEWSARLPSVLSVLVVALAFVTVARGTLGASGSLIGALVWMTNFGMVGKGRLIELEALYASLAGLAFICWLSWWQERRSPWLTWTVPWIFLGLGLLAKGPLHLVFFYAVVLAVLYRNRELRAIWNFAHMLGLLLMLGIFAAWAVPCLLAAQGSEAAHTWVRVSGRLTGQDFNLGGWIQNIPRGLGYFLPWTILLFFARRAFQLWETRNVERRTSNIERRTDDHSVASFSPRSTFDVSVGLAWGVGVSFVAVSLLPGSLPRYTMPLLAPAAWLIASLLTTERFEFPPWLRLRRPAALSPALRWPALITALVCVAMLTYAVALMPLLRKREKVRNIAAQINAALPAHEPLYAVDPDYQPFLFYVRDPILYVPSLAELPADAREVLVQARDESAAIESVQWQPCRARPVLRLQDYRNKSVVLLRIGSEP